MDTVEFGMLYEKYASDVLRFAFYLSGNRAEAEDIASETFVRAWVSRGEIREVTVKAYLLQIARNLFLTERRKKGRAVPLDEAAPDPAARPDVVASDRDELRGVLDAMGRLSEGDRAALVMRASGGLSYEEIATALSISVVAARVRVHRARLALGERRDRT